MSVDRVRELLLRWTQRRRTFLGSGEHRRNQRSAGLRPLIPDPRGTLDLLTFLPGPRKRVLAPGVSSVWDQRRFH